MRTRLSQAEKFRRMRLVEDPAGVSTDAADADDAGVIRLLHIVLRLTASKSDCEKKGSSFFFCFAKIE